MAYYRIERIDGLTFGDLSTDTSKKKELTDALKDFSDNGWNTFQISESAGGLLVFMSHE